MNLTIIYVYEPSLQKPLPRFFRKVTRVAKVFASKIVLKIYCKLTPKYLAVEQAMGSFGTELKARYRARSGADGPSHLSISLLTGEKGWNIV